MMQTKAVSIQMPTEGGAITALAALAHAHRLRVFKALVAAGEAGHSAGALAAMLDMPASSMSFHLKELSRADLASGKADGRFVIYRANYDQMTGLLAYLTEHCCAASGGPRCAPDLVCCPPAATKPAAPNIPSSLTRRRRARPTGEL